MTNFQFYSRSVRGCRDLCSLTNLLPYFSSPLEPEGDFSGGQWHELLPLLPPSVFEWTSGGKEVKCVSRHAPRYFALVCRGGLNPNQASFRGGLNQNLAFLRTRAIVLCLCVV